MLDEHARMTKREFACLSGCEVDLTDGYLLGQPQDIGRAGAMRYDHFAILFSQCLNHFLRRWCARAESAGHRCYVSATGDAHQLPFFAKAGECLVNSGATTEMQEFLGRQDASFREGLRLLQNSLG